MVNGGIGTNKAWSYMRKETGDIQELQCWRKDGYDCVYNLRLKIIQAGDGQSWVNHLQAQQTEDTIFYYSVQFD